MSETFAGNYVRNVTQFVDFGPARPSPLRRTEIIPIPFSLSLLQSVCGESRIATYQRACSAEVVALGIERVNVGPLHPSPGSPCCKVLVIRSPRGWACHRSFREWTRPCRVDRQDPPPIAPPGPPRSVQMPERPPPQGPDTVGPIAARLPWLLWLTFSAHASGTARHGRGSCVPLSRQGPHPGPRNT